ncbi:hypothetical protein ACFXJ6_07775 [Streptomyces sp. NPDC059218]|uniref:hypothetical protein n=1 Tax=unclassified Streptomyces TaxID=2593676 RepID=UPI0036953C69
MSPPPEPETQAVAVELERLRGTVTTGFAEVKGSLAVLVERSTRTEQDLARLRAETQRSLEALEAGTEQGLVNHRVETQRSLDLLKGDVEALKARRWPLGVVGAVAGVVGAATGAFALFR